MPRNTPVTNLGHESLAFFCAGTVLQLLSAALIYIHVVSYVQIGSPIPKPQDVTLFLYLFIAGTFVQLYSAYWVYVNGFYARIMPVLIVLSALGINAFFPVSLTGVFSPLPFFVTAKWGNRGSQVVTIAQAAWSHIYDCIKYCRDSERNPRDNPKCANVVIQSAFGFGFAVLGYQIITTWE